MRVVRTSIGIFLSGVLFLLDQTLKYFARTHSTASWYVIKPYLGWEFFGNTGIAFSLPVPQLVLIGVTPLILLWFFMVAKKQQTADSRLITATAFIVIGAISNFIDRMLFSYTIDYIRVGNGILNIADLMILAGVILILLREKNQAK